MIMNDELTITYNGRSIKVDATILQGTAYVMMGLAVLSLQDPDVDRKLAIKTADELYRLWDFLKGQCNHCIDPTLN